MQGASRFVPEARSGQAFQQFNNPLNLTDKLQRIFARGKFDTQVNDVVIADRFAAVKSARWRGGADWRRAGLKSIMRLGKRMRRFNMFPLRCPLDKIHQRSAAALRKLCHLMLRQNVYTVFIVQHRCPAIWTIEDDNWRVAAQIQFARFAATRALYFKVSDHIGALAFYLNSTPTRQIMSMNKGEKSSHNLRNGEIEPIWPVERKKKLRNACKKALKKHSKTLKKQELELAEARHAQSYRRMADSISAQPQNISRGSSSCTIQNVYTGENETIKLNPKLTAHKNAALYYRKAKKGERGQKIAEEKVRLTQEKIALVEQLARQLDALQGDDTIAAAIDALEQRAREMEIAGLDTASGAQRKKELTVPYRRFIIDKFEVFIGKTEAQNDELTTKFAKPWDIWMHVSAHAGSHVVVRRKKGTDWPSRAFLEKAGALAVWFSKARHTSYAEVHVTEARFVRKPRGFAPGKVIAERGKTIRVAPKSPKELFETAQGDDTTRG